MTLAEMIADALRDGATADELVAMRFAVARTDVHEVHNALTTAIEAVFADKASA